MDIKQIVKTIQNQPYETKVRILWGTTLVIGILLLVIWVGSLKSTINNLNQQPKVSSQHPESNVAYVRVERVEVLNDSTKIFFSVKNDTDDILNFSTMDDITLNINATEIKPVRLLNRQSSTFVSKILSRSEQFGILVFNQNLQDLGQLTFDQLYFEKQPETIFKETVEVDFDKLLKEQEPRD